MDDRKMTADRERADAADRAPKPTPADPAAKGDGTERQDGSNDERLTDEGRAIKADKINSANDE